MPKTIRRMQEPSMFTVAPRGMEKLESAVETPSFSVQTRMFVGMAAERTFSGRGFESYADAIRHFAVP